MLVITTGRVKLKEGVVKPSEMTVAQLSRCSHCYSMARSKGRICSFPETTFSFQER